MEWETWPDIRHIKEMKETLIEGMHDEFNKGLECVNANEAGAVIDMIKDLAEAEYYIRKAEYYRVVTKAMNDATPEEVSKMHMEHHPEMKSAMHPTGA